MTGGANEKAFGFLVLDGPSSVVQTLRKRDGSHWHIVSCEGMRETGATLRMVCLNDSKDSNCHRLHERGAEGTVVAMPNGCGPGRLNVPLYMAYTNLMTSLSSSDFFDLSMTTQITSREETVRFPEPIS